MAAFDGENPNGIWTLEISDDAAGNVGVLNSWSLTITGAERSTVTDQDGNYQFPSLRAGDYNVVEVLQPGWVQTHSPGPVTLGAGGGAIDVDFGNHALPGSISGQKWNDVNFDGVKDSGEAGLEGWTIELLAPSDEPTIETIDSTDVPVPIDDLSTVTSTLTVTSLGAIQDIDVTVNLTHTWDGDLIGTLISPSGTRVELFFRVGGSGDDFVDTVFDDEATTPISGGTAPFTGSFQPSESLSAFDGEDPNGDWTLEIRDAAGQDIGSIDDWSLTFTANSYIVIDTTVTDIAGNYTFADLIPGPYAVDEVLQPGWLQTFVPIPFTVGPGENVIDADIGNRALAGGITGQKWHDKNGDGIKQPGEPGLADWLIYLDQNNNGVFDPDGFQTTAGTNQSEEITDYHTTISQLLYQGPSGNDDVNVTLNITHSYDADLVVYVTSPSGTRVRLFGDVGTSGENFISTTLDDEAFQPIADGLPPFTGSFKPEEALSAFDGQDPNGVWTLEIYDDAQADTGTLNSWSITVTGFENSTTTDEDGFYAFTELPFGDYHVREVQQLGWTQTYSPPTVTIAPGDEFANVDLGNHAAVGSIQGYVYQDVGGNAAKDPADPGLPAWRVYLDADGDGEYGLDSINEFVDADIPKAINSFFVVSSTLWFDTLTEITDINLILDITHTYDADLTAYLIAPSGTRVKLFSGVGGSGNDFQGTQFDDSAAQSITTGTAPFDDNFVPQELLSAFNGQNAYGLWTLEITDSSVADDGSLNFWSLEVTGNEYSVVTDAQGAYAFTNLAPGDFSVGVVQKPAWIQTENFGPPWPTITIAPAQNVLNRNFGDRPPVHLLGDYNRDGAVDSADYSLWRLTLDSTVTNFSGADGDGDGTVDQDDYNIWRAHFGEVLPIGGSGSGALIQSDDAGVSRGQEQTGYSGSTTVIAGSLLSISRVSDLGQVFDSANSLSVAEPTIANPTLRLAVGGGPSATATNSLTQAQFGDSQQKPIILKSVRLQQATNLLQTLFQPGVATLATSAKRIVNSSQAMQPIEKPVENKPDKPLFSSIRTSASQCDLGLLAWLDSGSAGAGPEADFSESTFDFNVSSSGESSEQLDAAFETLEAGALAVAAI